MKKSRMIEDYLDGLLSKQEKKEFEKKLGEDKELADLLKFHAEVNESIRDHELHDLRRKLKELYNKVCVRPVGKEDKSVSKREDKGSRNIKNPDS
ncbi:MAG: hypothetical protein JXA61_03165 [Bacteroidales bacterium]|nr:hypothetical protein [Bacteroidales bacterium]